MQSVSPVGTEVEALHATSIIEDIRTLYVHPNPEGNFIEQAKKNSQKAAYL